MERLIIQSTSCELHACTCSVLAKERKSGAPLFLSAQFSFDVVENHSYAVISENPLLFVTTSG